MSAGCTGTVEGCSCRINKRWCLSVVERINTENTEIKPPAARDANSSIRNTGVGSGILVGQTKLTVDIAD